MLRLTTPVEDRKVFLTKEFSFEMAHALKGYDGACKNIHGHSYVLEITVSGLPKIDDAHPKNGMLIDFKELKKVVNANVVGLFDHALVLKSDHFVDLDFGDQKVVRTSFQPTCENFCLYIAEVLKGAFNAAVELDKIKLYETATSFCEWVRAV